MSVCVCVYPYQSTTTQQDHENDKGLEPVVLDDDEAGFPQSPPAPPAPLLHVHLTALKPHNAAWDRREGRKFGNACWISSKAI